MYTEFFGAAAVAAKSAVPAIFSSQKLGPIWRGAKQFEDPFVEKSLT